MCGNASSLVPLGCHLLSLGVNVIKMLTCDFGDVKRVYRLVITLQGE